MIIYWQNNVGAKVVVHKYLSMSIRQNPQIIGGVVVSTFQAAWAKNTNTLIGSGVK